MISRLPIKGLKPTAHRSPGEYDSTRSRPAVSAAGRYLSERRYPFSQGMSCRPLPALGPRVEEKGQYQAIAARQGHPQVDITPLAKPVPIPTAIAARISVVEASRDTSASLDGEESSVSTSFTSSPGGEVVPTPTTEEVALADVPAVHDPPAEAKVDPASPLAPSPPSECPIAAEGESITITVTETASATATTSFGEPALSAERTSSAHVGEASVDVATNASESSVIDAAIQYPSSSDTASLFSASATSTASVASETISASAADAFTASAEESSPGSTVLGVVPDGVEGSIPAVRVDDADNGVGMEGGTAAPAALVVEGGVGSNATGIISEVGPIEVVDSETGAIDLEAGVSFPLPWEKECH